MRSDTMYSIPLIYIYIHVQLVININLSTYISCNKWSKYNKVLDISSIL